MCGTPAARLLVFCGVNEGQSGIYFLFQTKHAPLKAVALDLDCTLHSPEWLRLGPTPLGVRFTMLGPGCTLV